MSECSNPLPYSVLFSINQMVYVRVWLLPKTKNISELGSNEIDD